ncbi:FtsW/RodA/SpoVE family cell cycle protein [Nonomuraea terrae]|uniref:FtsW/RodA/SpoVE family cell cycle protein n=1 Tax=Nonomuraea terrae TaxID=2530383 RepID=UPI003794530C
MPGVRAGCGCRTRSRCRTAASRDRGVRRWRHAHRRRRSYPYARLAAAGIACWLGVQTFVNVGKVIGLMPIVGVPLPFVSYGGSSIVSCQAAVGILISLTAAPASEPRLPGGRQPRLSTTPSGLALRGVHTCNPLSGRNGGLWG